MALKDVENIAIFHFNNICLSPVIFTSRSVCHASHCCFFVSPPHSEAVTAVICLHTVAAHP